MVEWLLKGKYAEPRDVQLEALRRSIEHNGWGHFLDMRLGKTAVAINEFMLLRKAHGLKWLLVISPNDYKEDWVAEIEACGIDLPVHAFQSSRRGDVNWFVAQNDGGAIIINYEAMSSKANIALLTHVCGPDTMIVADESVQIKNPAGRRTKYAIELAKLCRFRRLLTGKPVSQGPHDLWAQLRFVGAVSGWNYIAWRNAFCEMGGFQGKQITGLLNEKRLTDILESCSWTARKTDWLKTPGRDWMDWKIEMLPDQKKRYDDMYQTFVTELADGTLVSADQVVTKLLKIQQIASGFIIDEEGNAHSLMSVWDNPKLNATIEILERMNSKLIVFYFYRYTGTILRARLADYHPASLWSEGDNLVEKSRFTFDPKCRVMIAQIRSAKYGHNLMASLDDPCFTSLYFENTFSLDDRSQTEERNQGAGQQHPVTFIDFIASPRDRVNIEALRRKEDVAATLLRYSRESGILPRLGNAEAKENLSGLREARSGAA